MAGIMMSDIIKSGCVGPLKFGCRLRRSHGTSPLGHFIDGFLSFMVLLEGRDVPYHLHLVGLVKCVLPLDEGYIYVHRFCS
jgi:hypothetical protein